MKKKKSSGIGRKLGVSFFIILLFICGMFTIYVFEDNKENIKTMEHVLHEVENEEAILTEYIVYGTHLNMKGEIGDNFTNINSVILSINNVNGEQKNTNLDYEESSNGIKFSTSDLINTGINLEEIKSGKNLMIIEVEYGENRNKTLTKKYTIRNDTEYDKVQYYTITKNNSNNKIDIKFDTYKIDEKSVKYMYLDVKNAKLPKDVYDVVIDPGHGGSDVGAEGGGYKEANLTLEYAQKVKKELEKLNLKVKITRDGTENEEDFGVYSVYDEDGRVNIVGDSKAKYVFSIHLNSITEPNSLSGVEIYAPPKMDLKIAKNFAKNIVKYGNTTYSNLDAIYQKADGVYVRTFRDHEIESAMLDAKRDGYKAYNVTEGTPYLYMLRETGGIATGAYVDGRNPSYGTNKYYNSNVGVEAYLLELGYINHSANLKNLLNNKDGYVKGIVETIKQEILGK